MMYLIDTNIFLEILLNQDKSEDCKKFLNDHIGLLNISEFSLHSIGVILYRQNEKSIFQDFIKDILPKINLINLPKTSYKKLNDISGKYKLDFDDTYQYLICKFYSFELVTMDSDFKKVDTILVNYI